MLEIIYIVHWLLSLIYIVHNIYSALERRMNRIMIAAKSLLVLGQSLTDYNLRTHDFLFCCLSSFCASVNTRKDVINLPPKQ